nr:immunoglobulin heavy chain junction region [Mus musculus]MBK4186714.1 immunoglobulin heavy chain junction region [Mus musculus]
CTIYDGYMGLNYFDYW